MQLFRLTDDVHISGRWHLSEIMAGDRDTSNAFKRGCATELTGPLWACVSREGRALEFTLTSFAVPVVSRPLAAAISGVSGQDVQRVPLEVPGVGEYEILNTTKIVRCLDETRSSFVKWKAIDHRADLAGQYREVSKLVINPNLVPGDTQVFRIEGWRIGLVVSERVRSVMGAVGCLGAHFEEVTGRQGAC